MNIYNIFFGITIVLLFACNEPKEYQDVKVDKEVYKPDKQIDIKFSLAGYLKQSVSIKQIKEKCKGISTSTKLSNEEAKHYYNKTDDGFFGRYLLFFKSENQINEVGSLTIHSVEKSWKYNNDSDEFTELILLTNDVELLNGIKVGINTKELISHIGIPTIEENNLLYYFDETDNNWAAIFYVEEEKVTKIRVGKYKSDLSKQSIPNFLIDF